MSPEKAKELVNVYPALFSDLSHRNCFYLFSFECGDGWFELLKECIQGIKDICKRDNLDIKVSQVKEKFGSLRFYLDSETEEIGEIIKKAEDRSLETCEVCGDIGSLCDVGHRWYQTVCEKCFTQSSETFL